MPYSLFSFFSRLRGRVRERAPSRPCSTRAPTSSASCRAWRRAWDTAGRCAGYHRPFICKTGIVMSAAQQQAGRLDDCMPRGCTAALPTGEVVLAPAQHAASSGCAMLNSVQLCCTDLMGGCHRHAGNISKDDVHPSMIGVVVWRTKLKTCLRNERAHACCGARTRQQTAISGDGTQDCLLT